MTWTEISLIAEDGELAEAVAEVLGRYIPDGVFIQAMRIVMDPDSEGHGAAPYRVGGYLPEDDPETARNAIETALGHLSLIRPIPAPAYREIEAVDWTESWKKNFHAIEVGETLIIVPSWEAVETTGRTPIRIDPGMAFGTGTHPTTQLALRLLEQVLSDQPGADVLDIGSGSGILSIAAAKLGAGTVVGVDTDGESMANAARNAALNDAGGRVHFGAGSVGEILAGAYPIRQAPVVVANILAHILVMLMDDGMGSLISTGGRLILSGILAEREDIVMAAAERHGFRVQDRIQEGDWVAFTLFA